MLPSGLPKRSKDSGQASCVEVDVSSEVSVNEAFESLDSLDVLINNAGIASVGNGGDTGEEMDRVYAVNVKGVFNCAPGLPSQN